MPHQWGVIGISREQWTLVAAALTLGGNVRVGLEDNFYLPDGDDGALERRPGREGARDGRGRRPPRGDAWRRRASCSACRSGRPHERRSAGLRVLDLSRLLPGGFCSLLLADFGADVIKVEDTGMGDYVRWAEPHVRGRRGPPAPRCSSRSTATSARSGSTSRRDGGRDVLLRLARDADVLLESFRPGVMDRLGVGYERLREENPRLVYCAITGYGQDGPFARRAPGTTRTTSARIGLLDLTGDPDGPPVQSGGQIADLGGGALMAAFGILAALRERERSGEGQLVDVSMTDGALSWLAMVAARAPRRRRAAAPRPGSSSPAGCSATGRTAAPTAGSRSARWSRSSGAPGARASAATDLVERQFDAVGSDAHRDVEAIFAERTRARVGGVQRRARLLPRAGARARRGARVRARARARDGGRGRPAGRRPRPAARHAGQALAHARPTRRAPAGPALGADTDAVLAEAGYATSAALRIRRRCADGGSRCRRASAQARALKMSELAERSGVSAGTIKHYLREGLLRRSDVVRTSRNMAYYPPEFVDRIRTDQAPPGGALHAAAADPRGCSSEADPRLRDRRARARCWSATTCRATCSTGCAEIGVLTPDRTRLRPDDVQIIEAIVALPRRRLRRGARLHRLRHAALPRRARAAGRGGGAGAARAPDRRGRGRAAPSRSSRSGARAAARADRRDALEDAARGAGARHGELLRAARRRPLQPRRRTRAGRGTRPSSTPGRRRRCSAVRSSGASRARTSCSRARRSRSCGRSRWPRCR